MNNDELLEFVEDSMQSPYVVKNGFFVKTDERWTKVRYDEILWVRAFENGSVVFLTDGKSLMVNHRLWRIEEILQDHANFVRINRSEIVNLNAIDGFEGNCYYIGKNPLYATGVYRQRMEGVFIKAAIKRGQKSLLILLSVSRLGRRPRRSSNDDVKTEKSRPGAFS